MVSSPQLDMVASMTDASSVAVDLWNQAHAQFRARDYALFAELIGRLIAEHPDDPGLDMPMIRLQYGVALLRLGRTEEGVGQLRVAVELDPENPRAHQKLGAGLARLGKDLEALPHLERAAVMAPENPEYQWRVGEQYRCLGRLAEARAAFERCLLLDPNYLAASEGLAALTKAKGSWMKRLARARRRVLGG